MMKCKAFEAIVELAVQAVTCPGVWLCPNGKITVHIYMFGSCAQSEALEPVFPLLYHETFIFRKSFSEVRTLNDLDRLLDFEMLYVELIQWESNETGNILASFETPLTDVLYPVLEHRCVMPGVDVDLLMRTTKNFPVRPFKVKCIHSDIERNCYCKGIIAPKVEVTTKTTIEEVLCSFRNDRKKGAIVVNPKVISSKCCSKPPLPLRQKKVCHSSEYHNAHYERKFKKIVPTNRDFKFSSPRSAKYAQKQCNCNVRKKVYNKNYNLPEKKISKSPLVSGSECICNLKSTRILCPLCTKYKYYFEKPCGCTEDSSLLCDCKMRKYFQSIENQDANFETNKILRKAQCCNCEIKSRDFEKSPRSPYYDECQSQLKPSLAKQIHNRLEKALRANVDVQPPSGSSLRENFNQDSTRESCNEKFYKNLEDFYKELYKRTRYKTNHEICKNKAFNI